MWRQRKDEKPTWWLLYGICLILVALIALVEVTVPPGGLCTTLEMVLVIVMFGLMAVWLQFNRVALELQKGRRGR